MPENSEGRSLRKLKKNSSIFGAIIQDSQHVLNEIYNQRTGYFSDTHLNRDSVVLNKANRDSVKYSRGGIKWEIQSQVDAHDLLLIHHSQKSRAASTKAQRHYQPEEYNDSLEMNIEDQ